MMLTGSSVRRRRISGQRRRPRKTWWQGSRVKEDITSFVCSGKMHRFGTDGEARSRATGQRRFPAKSLLVVCVLLAV